VDELETLLEPEIAALQCVVGDRGDGDREREGARDERYPLLRRPSRLEFPGEEQPRQLQAEFVIDAETERDLAQPGRYRVAEKKLEAANPQRVFAKR